MDTGVSAAFKKRWPRMFEDYEKHCQDGRFRLGDVLVWNEGSHVVYSLGIQEHWKKKAKLAALTRALRRVAELASHAGIERVGLPRIGTGLGGLDWPRVKSVFEEVAAETTVSFVVFEQFIRAPAES
jgi:O-acetyl-ADP-ribose deacetylase (regulator of RNase III)